MGSFVLRQAACIALAGLIAGSAEAQARSAQLCNHSPVTTWVTVGYDSGSSEITRGWWKIMPGECNSWSIPSSNFYYRAEATGKLARWLNDGSSLVWGGWHRRCFNPTKRFKLSNSGDCRQKGWYSRTSVPTSGKRIPLYESNHSGVALSQATELRRVLSGRMEYEELLRKTSGREPHFQLGVDVRQVAQGLEVRRVYEGMPAEGEGLDIGDIITRLDGRRIVSLSDLHGALRRIDILRVGPVNIQILRNGERLEGTISPLFFEFNHPEYNPNGGAGTFLWSFANESFFGLGNLAGCSVVYGALEGIDALADDRSFSTRAAADASSRCSRGLNRELAKKELLYEKAATAGMWASLAAPGIPAAKLARLGKATSLAGKSRFVAR